MGARGLRGALCEKLLLAVRGQERWKEGEGGIVGGTEPTETELGARVPGSAPTHPCLYRAMSTALHASWDGGGGR